MLSFLHLPVKNLLKEKTCLTPSIDIPFQELLEKFKNFSETFAVFLKDRKPVGIITERDLLRAFYQGYPLNGPAFHLAKKELFKIKANQSLLQAFNLMTENFIRRLIVVDEKDNFLGVITQKELIFYSSEDLFKGEGKIRDLLDVKACLIYAEEEETLREALSKMVQFNIGALPILDKNKRPIGIISEKDFLFVENLEKPLKEVALKKVITIEVTDPIIKGIELFKKYNIRHLVVVDPEDRAIHVLSQRDFVQSLTCSYSEYLKENLKQAKNFISLLPEIVLELIECDSECKISWMNEFAKKTLGEEYLEKDIYTLLDYDEWNRIYGILKREKIIYKNKIKGKKGNVFEITGTLLDFGAGEIRIKIFLRDITSEVLKEETFQREIRFLKSFLDNSLDYIFVIDKEGRIRFANNSFKKALGFSEEEIRKKTIFDIVDLPEKELRKNIERLLKKGEEIRGRRFYRDIYKNLIPVEIKAKGVLLNGEPFIIINARDISESLTCERKLTQNLKYLNSFYSFSKDLSLAYSEEELFDVLEKYFLKYGELLHYFGIDPITGEVLTTYLKGKKEGWEDCLVSDVKECKVFKTGSTFLSDKTSPCSFLKIKDKYSLCMPLFFEGKLEGILTLLREEPFSEEEVKYLEDKKRVFNVFLNQLKLLKEYRELSIRDPLLGIYNRRFLIEVLKKEEERAKRSVSSFSLLLMDLDKFKRINDQYGHFIGDLVLRKFCEIVLLNIRNLDILGRWGGEEFLLLLPETFKEKAVIVAERIREVLEKTEIFVSEGLSLKITVSIGVAEYPQDGLFSEEIIKKADLRLYKAKELGRNRVVSE